MNGPQWWLVKKKKLEPLSAHAKAKTPQLSSGGKKGSNFFTNDRSHHDDVPVRNVLWVSWQAIQ